MDTGHAEADKKLRTLEKKITSVYTQASKELEQRILKHYADFDRKDAIKKQELEQGIITKEQYNYWRTGQIMTGQRWEQLRDNIAKDLTNKNNIALNMVKEHMLDVYAINHNYGTFEAEHGSGIDTLYTLYDRDTVEFLIKKNPNMLKPPTLDINKDIRWNKKNFVSGITQGILQGDSISHLAKRVALGTTKKDKNASIRNARTATTYAENTGRVDSYKRAKSKGININQVWIAALDERTRTSHRLLNGQKVKAGQKFKTANGYKLSCPGDPAGPAEEVWNCRCTLVAEVEGASPVVNDDLKKNPVLQTMTYDEWLKSKAISKHYGESVKHYNERIAKKPRIIKEDKPRG
jgi:hypothetical protein